MGADYDNQESEENEDEIMDKQSALEGFTNPLKSKNTW